VNRPGSLDCVGGRCRFGAFGQIVHAITCPVVRTPDAFDRLRDDLRRAVWWARTWAVALQFRNRHHVPSSPIRVRVAGGRSSKVVLRSTRTTISGLQSWRVHKHEKAAWSRLEELTQ